MTLEKGTLTVKGPEKRAVSRRGQRLPPSGHRSHLDLRLAVFLTAWGMDGMGCDASTGLPPGAPFLPYREGKKGGFTPHV